MLRAPGAERRRRRRRLASLAAGAHEGVDADARQSLEHVVHGAVRVRGDQHGLPGVHERADDRGQRRGLARAGETLDQRVIARRQNAAHRASLLVVERGDDRRAGGGQRLERVVGGGEVKRGRREFEQPAAQCHRAFVRRRERVHQSRARAAGHRPSAVVAVHAPYVGIRRRAGSVEAHDALALDARGDGVCDPVRLFVRRRFEHHVQDDHATHHDAAALAAQHESVARAKRRQIDAFAFLARSRSRRDVQLVHERAGRRA